MLTAVGPIGVQPFFLLFFFFFCGFRSPPRLIAVVWGQIVFSSFMLHLWGRKSYLDKIHICNFERRDFRKVGLKLPSAAPRSCGCFLLLQSCLGPLLEPEKVQRRAARWSISNYDYRSSVTAMVDSLRWRSLEKETDWCASLPLLQNWLRSSVTAMVDSLRWRSLEKETDWCASLPLLQNWLRYCRIASIWLYTKSFH